jgi:hypothetical protein
MLLNLSCPAVSQISAGKQVETNLLKGWFSAVQYARCLVLQTWTPTCINQVGQPTLTYRGRLSIVVLEVVAVKGQRIGGKRVGFVVIE